MNTENTGNTESVFRLPLPDVPENWDYREQRSVFSAKTYSYFPIDQAKSALQKTVRRGYPESIQWALEMWLCDGKIRTNVWNRLLIIAVEDIGPADPQAIITTYSIYKHYRNDILGVATVTDYLNKCVKTRASDDLIHRVRDTVVYPETIDINETIQKFRKAMDDNNAEEAMMCYYMLNKCNQKLKGKKYRKPPWLVWEWFIENIGGPYIDTLRELAMSPNWRWQGKSAIIVSHIILLWCSGSDFSNLNGSQSPELSELNNDLEDTVKRIQNRESLVGVPDIALDKHTRSGKSLGRGITHFLKVCAVVEPESLYWRKIINSGFVFE